MARRCELTGKGPIKGSIIWRSGKAKKSGGIGTHVTAITKRKFLPNLQRVKALIDGEVRYVRVSTRALKKGLVTKAPKRTWKKPEVKAYFEPDIFLQARRQPLFFIFEWKKPKTPNSKNQRTSKSQT